MKEMVSRMGPGLQRSLNTEDLAPSVAPSEKKRRDEDTIDSNPHGWCSMGVLGVFMHMFRYIRGAFALFVGGALFGVGIIVSLFLGIGERLLGLYRYPSRFRSVPGWIGWVVWRVAYEGILGAKAEWTSDVPEREEGEVFLIIAPHPSDLATLPMAYALWREVAEWYTFGAASKTKWTVGLPMELIDVLFLFNRDKREEALKTIYANVLRICANGGVIGILPDRSRPTPVRLLVNHNKYLRKPGNTTDPRWFPFTYVPLDGGVAEIIKACEGKKVTIINVVAAWSAPEMSTFDVVNLVGATYHFSAKVVTLPSPTDNPAAFRSALNALWRENNVWIGDKKHVSTPSSTTVQ